MTRYSEECSFAREIRSVAISIRFRRALAAYFQVDDTLQERTSVHEYRCLRILRDLRSTPESVGPPPVARNACDVVHGRRHG